MGSRRVRPWGRPWGVRGAPVEAPVGASVGRPLRLRVRQQGDGTRIGDCRYIPLTPFRVRLPCVSGLYAA